MPSKVISMPPTNDFPKDAHSEIKFLDSETIRVGQKVIHHKFGEGIVIFAEGSGTNARAQVDFGRYGEKWLALAIAKLTAFTNTQNVQGAPIAQRIPATKACEDASFVAPRIIRSAAVEQQLVQAMALKCKLIDVLSAAARAGAEPGKRKSKKPPKTHDLLQTLNLSAEAWQPIVEEVSVTDLDRTRSMLAGPFFTSAEYPIPTSKHGMLMPVAQLDLRQLAVLGQPALGDGLFQLWCDPVFEASPREVIRVIPRAEVQPQALTSFAFVMPEFDVTPIDWDVLYDPDTEKIKVLVGFESLGMQCQTGELVVYTAGPDEEIDDAISEDLTKYKEITSFASRDIQLFGSFYPIQYSAADIGMPCLICFRSWGSDGNAQVFYAGESVGYLRFEESLR